MYLAAPGLEALVASNSRLRAQRESGFCLDLERFQLAACT